MPGAYGSIGPQKMSQRCAPSIPAADWWWRDGKHPNMVETFRKNKIHRRIGGIIFNYRVWRGNDSKCSAPIEIIEKNSLFMFFHQKVPNSARSGWELSRDWCRTAATWNQTKIPVVYRVFLLNGTTTHGIQPWLVAVQPWCHRFSPDW